MTKKNTNKTTQIPTAQLLIGTHAHLVAHVTKELQHIFCQTCAQDTKKHKHCPVCKQIENQQYHGAIWIKPEKKYTRDQIQVIFDTISFKLQEGNKLFFILQHADFLTDACSNSLLKSVEEPPQGYHFIFLAERPSLILPTIKSRCMVRSFYEGQQEHNQNQLTSIFKNNTVCSPDAFLKILDQEKPSEKDTVEIIDALLKHWLAKSKQAISNDDQQTHMFALSKVNKLKQALTYSPMPGSSKIFWRNLYLQFK
ncbi:hypothetical protein ACFLYU_03590 [Candidatus Dependentiae bacterium]